MHGVDMQLLAEKHGGRFRLGALLLKRAKQLVLGDPPLADLKTDNAVAIAIHEANAGLIELKEPGESTTDAPAEKG